MLAAVLAARLVVAEELPSLGDKAAKAKSAAGHPHGASLEDISSKLDNPLSDLWMENDRMRFNGDAFSKNRTVNVWGSMRDPGLRQPTPAS